MKATFIITTAINTNIGIYDPWSRMQQVNQTINSIYDKFKECYIMLVDGGKPITDAEMLNHFESIKRRVNVYLDMTADKQVEHLHTNFLDKIETPYEMGGMTGLTKSAAENIIMYNALHALQYSPDLENMRAVDRIFKISGRYQLSPLFDASVYAGFEDKYVFKERTKSWMPDAQQALGIEYCYQSRLWSLPAHRLAATVDIYADIIKDCLEISKTHYVDIEHLLFKHIGTEHSAELDYLHLMGSIAPNGTLIYD